MIRVHKPAQPPHELVAAGLECCARHIASYEAAPASFISGEATFEFDAKVYAHTSVKDTLREAQHHKCCFCEAKVSHVSFGDVEHFRPKAAVRQSRAEAPSRPGYYWLAYEWTNLYFACQLCNQRNKHDLFPLEAPAQRARIHSDNTALAAEQPRFIDPGVDDPERLIGFRAGEPYPINDNARATLTITALELGRRLLMEQRDEKIRALSMLLDIMDGVRSNEITGGAALATFVEDAATILASSTEDRGEFTSAVRYLLRDRLGHDLRFPLSAAALVAYARGQWRPVNEGQT